MVIIKVFIIKTCFELIVDIRPHTHKNNKKKTLKYASFYLCVCLFSLVAHIEILSNIIKKICNGSEAY